MFLAFHDIFRRYTRRQMRKNLNRTILVRLSALSETQLHLPNKSKSYKCSQKEMNIIKNYPRKNSNHKKESYTITTLLKDRADMMQKMVKECNFQIHFSSTRDRHLLHLLFLFQPSGIFFTEQIKTVS